MHEIADACNAQDTEKMIGKNVDANLKEKADEKGLLDFKRFYIGRSVWLFNPKSAGMFSIRTGRSRPCDA